MLIRVRTNVGLWRVDLDSADATPQDVLHGIARTRPHVVYEKPLSSDPGCTCPLVLSRALTSQNIGHGSMVHCRVDPDSCSVSSAADASAVSSQRVSSQRVERAAAVASSPAREGGGNELPADVVSSPKNMHRDSDAVELDDKNEDDECKNEDVEDEKEEDEEGTPTCRICLGEGIPAASVTHSTLTEDDDDRLISPCLCRGSIRYVHIGCLQRWRRSAHGRSDSALRCGQCRYRYGVRQTALALFLLSERGAIALAVFSLVLSMHVLGALAFTVTTDMSRTSLYRWLRLGARYGGMSRWLTETPYGEMLTLGGATLGCLFFTSFAIQRTLRRYNLYRHGLIGPEGFYPDLGFLFLWIHAETMQNGSGRGVAVVGLFMASYHSYGGAMAKAKHAAQWLGETILEPTAADRRRHRQEQDQAQRQR